MFTCLNFAALPHLKCVDFIFGLPEMKELNMSIQPSKDLVLIGNISFSCESQPRRVSLLLVDSSKMQKVFARAARNKHIESELFLGPLHFPEELESITTDFGPELNIPLKELDNEFADVTQEPQRLPPHRGIFDHTIRLTAYPKRQRRNRLCCPEYEELTRQITDLFKQALVRVSNSPYAAPIILVRKRDGSILVCIDHKALNRCIVQLCFSLSRIDDLLDKLCIAKSMTHLDLRSTYNQVRMSDDGPHDDSVASTGFQGLKPNGVSCLLERLVMGFGLCNNALATFSGLMNHVLEPYIEKIVIVYLDDICIYSEILEQHIEHVRLVLQKLREHQFLIKMPKCV
jgi:hypothetical protein